MGIPDVVTVQIHVLEVFPNDLSWYSRAKRRKMADKVLPQRVGLRHLLHIDQGTVWVHYDLLIFILLS